MSTEYVLPLLPRGVDPTAAQRQFLVLTNGLYRVGTSIADVPYLFDVRWNVRAAAWFMDIREQNETPIAMGIKIVLGAYLGRRCQHALFRDGVFVAEDTTNQGREATFDDLGSRVIVKYIPAVELVRRLSGA